MAVTVPEARSLVLGFCRNYPVAAQLTYYIRDTVEELYGDRAKGMDMLGGYITGPAIHPGRCDIPSGKAKDADDFVTTLRHEVIGHFGLNTFTGDDKKALLDGISAARLEPSMRGLWAVIDKHYAGQPESIKAEEVFALYCEGIEPNHHALSADQVHERGAQSFHETCRERSRPMQIDDLDNITLMVAQGLHDRTRTQQNFPELNQQFRKDRDMEAKKPFHEKVAEKLIQQLKEGTAPWQKPWEPGQPRAFIPINPTTGKRYRGINAIQLMSQGHKDQRWMTYKQASVVGAQVRKGEKGTPIQYWKFSEDQTKTDAQGKPVLDGRGEPVKLTVKLERPRVFFATVFNAEQIDGMPPLQPRKEQEWSAVERAEQILKASGAVIRHGEENRAFYRPATDSIHLPDKSQFPTANNYYATALHELGHWTGHDSRLDRDLVHPFGSEGYAKEELRAEIASMIMGDELGIGHDPAQHAAYVGSWIKVLQNDPLEIFRAAADAEKIQDYVLGLEQKHIQEQTSAQSQVVETIELMAELRALHLTANAGYSPLESWENLSKTAEEYGLAARITEERVRRDPNSTAEDISAAKEARQDAEMVAMTSDEDLQRRMAEFDRQQQQAMPAAAQEQRPEKTYINVPFKQKDEAKAIGAKWDRQEQSWYVPAGVDAAPFAKWAKGATEAVAAPQRERATQGREYLAVPYGERIAAKAAGAQWDKTAKSWYAGSNADMGKLERWKPENAQGEQDPAMTPREEFADALRSIGFVVSGEHPIMDGKKHRVSVEGEKFSEKAGSGFYVGHLDGHPAGFMKNNKTGIDMKWKAKGYTLDPEEKAHMAAEAATKLQAREAEQTRLHEVTAHRVGRQAAGLVPVEQPTPYMQAKGIASQAGVLTDREGQKTYISATDVDGKQWSMQYIQEDGTKRFAKDSRKEGCFHAVGGMDALAQAPALVIGEGYATASSLSESLGFATVAAFDSGNLPQVAKALHEKFPDKPVIIAGDDDRHLEATQGVNPGKSKAQEAAKLTGGKVLLPIFAPGENSYPTDLEPVTPEKFREHQRTGNTLDDKQLAALDRMKGKTDFNDLATKSELGKDGINRQVRAVVNSVIEKHQERTQMQDRVQEQRPSRATKIG